MVGQCGRRLFENWPHDTVAEIVLERNIKMLRIQELPACEEPSLSLRNHVKLKSTATKPTFKIIILMF